MAKEPSQINNIVKAVRENIERRDACRQHAFDPKEFKGLGSRMTCINCKATADMNYVGAYVRGWEAHGGDPNEIWPGWHERQSEKAPEGMQSGPDLPPRYNR